MGLGREQREKEFLTIKEQHSPYRTSVHFKQILTFVEFSYKTSYSSSEHFTACFQELLNTQGAMTIFSLPLFSIYKQR